MSKRKGETAAEYSARMSEYQRIRRLKENGLPVPETLPPKRYIPRGRPRKWKPASQPSEWTAAGILAREQITLAGSVSNKPKPDDKPKCFGDLYRAQKEAAGLIGAGSVAPVVTQATRDEQRVPATAAFKATIRPIIAKFAGRVVRIDMILADADVPDTMTPGSAMMAVAGELAAAGAERLPDHKWQLPLTIHRPTAAGRRSSKSKIRGDTPGNDNASQGRLKREIGQKGNRTAA